MIRMGKQVSGKLIIVPYKTRLEVVFDGVHADSGKLLS